MIDLISKTSLSVKKQRDLAITATVVMVIANFVLGFSLLYKDEKVILVPPTLREKAWVGNHTVSEEYLREQALFFLHLFLDIQPRLLSYHASVILDHTAPESTDALRVDLYKAHKEYEDIGVTMSFVPKIIKVDQSNMSAVAEGSLVKYHNNEMQPTEEKSYFIKFDYNRGHILLKEFKEVREEDLPTKSIFGGFLNESK